MIVLLLLFIVSRVTHLVVGLTLRFTGEQRCQKMKGYLNANPVQSLVRFGRHLQQASRLLDAQDHTHSFLFNQTNLTPEFSGEPHTQLSIKATLCGESAAMSCSAAR